jgi:hypothetical protein
MQRLAADAADLTAHVKKHLLILLSALCGQEGSIGRADLDNFLGQVLHASHPDNTSALLPLSDVLSPHLVPVSGPPGHAKRFAIVDVASVIARYLVACPATIHPLVAYSPASLSASDGSGPSSQSARQYQVTADKRVVHIAGARRGTICRRADETASDNVVSAGSDVGNHVDTAR